MLNEKIARALELIDLVAGYPLAVAFSGGKDSTVALDLIGRYAVERKVERVYVIYNETWLDPPIVRDWVYDHLLSVEQWAKRNNQPFKVLVITPPPGKDFFTLVLERGYALPVIRRHAPWCNKEMKTRPTARLLRRILREEGYDTLVYVTGSRITESPRRRKSLENLGVTQALKKVKMEYLGEVYFLAPVYDWSDEEVFEYLRNNDSVYGDSFGPLLELYRRYGENGVKLRTGCWTCPQVPRDYFMEAYAREHPEYRAVLEARKKIIAISENPKYRTAISKNGHPAGRITEEGRRQIAEVLCRLLETRAGREMLADYLENVPRFRELLRKYGCSLVNV